MRQALPLALLLALAPAAPGRCASAPAPATLAQAASLWQCTERGVRDHQLSRARARRAFLRAFEALGRLSPRQGPLGRWAFPLPGYGPSDFSPLSYRPRGFDYYLGTGKGAPHPAVDIFVDDRRERQVDDRTGGPIPVVAAFGGVVVSAEQGWEHHDRWHGGVYAYVMRPQSGWIAYYAHLERLDVVLGQVVRGGQLIGYLGRTGVNADKRRSPTHLHLMWMRFRAGTFKVFNPTRPLRRARLEGLKAERALAQVPDRPSRRRD